MILLAASLSLTIAIAAVEPEPGVAAIVEGITAEKLLERVNDLVAFRTRRYDQPGGRAAQDYILDFLSRLPLDEVHLQDYDAYTDNVIGILLGGVRPDVRHVIGAHYDSIANEGFAGPAPGADDNASGTAALLEIARAISESGLRPAETIVFAAFAAEEPGLKGSQAYVDALRSQGKTVADMICLDVIGYVKPGTRPDLSVTSSEFTPAIIDLISRISDVSAAYLPAWPFESGAGCG